MWFPPFAKLATLLLSAPSNTRIRTTTTTTATTTTTTTTGSPLSSHTSAASVNGVAGGGGSWPPQCAVDLSEAYRQAFRDLEKPGALHEYASPTLRFSYVSPPDPVDGTSTWKRTSSSSSSTTTTGGESSGRLELPEHLKPDPSKPLAVYLPGLDGYGLSAFSSQFDDLAGTFEFWRLTVLPHDRSSFVEVVRAVSDFVTQLARDSDGDGGGRRPVTLISESCGGLVATAVALRLQQQHLHSCSSSGEREDGPLLQGLVLANPATSYDKTLLDTFVPFLTSLQYLNNNDNEDKNHDNNNATPYSVIGSLFLGAIIPDNDQYKRIWDMIVNLPTLDIPVTDPEQLRDVWDATLDMFTATEERLPADLIDHRLGWARTGAALVKNRMKDIQVPTLVVVGDQDKLLPSADDGERLVKEIPRSKKLLVKGRGHLVLDENVNLTEAILYSDIDPLNWKRTRKPYDPILDWSLSSKELDKIKRDRLKSLRSSHSPVFFSTDERDGRRCRGLSKVPKPDDGRPILVVGNHQFIGLDLTLLIAELYEERGIYLRGLAHPVAFLQNPVGELRGREPGLVNGSADNGFVAGTQNFQEFGAVPVTPRNYYRLLQTGQSALLFPGGAREAISGRTDYPLFWPTGNKVDFVRTAAKFNATIVPLSAVGMVESFNVGLEAKQVSDGIERVRRLPFVGNFSFLAPPGGNESNVRAARYDEKDQVDLGFPLAFPGIPARNYFLFGEPISTEDVDHRDLQACADVYKRARREVRRGINDLVRAREKDPYHESSLRRLAYERLTGKSAPTFPVDELNNKRGRLRRLQ